jgi:hypothetical protein
MSERYSFPLQHTVQASVVSDHTERKWFRYRT